MESPIGVSGLQCSRRISDRNQRCRLQRIDNSQQSLPRPRQKGLERTILMLDSLQIPYAGTYTDSTARASRYPLLLEQNGFRIVLLNYTYGTNGIKVSAPNIVNYIDKDIMARDIETAKSIESGCIDCMYALGHRIPIAAQQGTNISCRLVA